MAELVNFCPKSVFITGSSRGLGLEFVRQLCALQNPPKHLFATCRNPEKAKDLQELAGKHSFLHLLKLDVTKYDTFPTMVEKVKGHLGGTGLNLLINNAGTIIRTGFEEATPEEMRSQFETNCIAPLMVTKSLVSLLRLASSQAGDSSMGCNRAAIVHITTALATISNSEFWASGNRCPYRCSKYALNMLNKCESVDLLPDKIAAYLFHPGWVQTDMGGPKADVTSQTAIAGIIKCMAKFGEAENGLLHCYDGEIVQW